MYVHIYLNAICEIYIHICIYIQKTNIRNIRQHPAYINIINAYIIYDMKTYLSLYFT